MTIMINYVLGIFIINALLILTHIINTIVILPGNYKAPKDR